MKKKKEIKEEEEKESKHKNAWKYQAVSIKKIIITIIIVKDGHKLDIKNFVLDHKLNGVDHAAYKCQKSGNLQHQPYIYMLSMVPGAVLGFSGFAVSITAFDGLFNFKRCQI